LDRGPSARDGGVERSAFRLVEIVACIIDDEIELCPFGKARGLVYNEAAVTYSGANR
jgi:hypothetical protein